MRIIAGEYKNRKLVAPKDLKIRPTMDRTKEALFNIINHNIYDKSFLDLFAGSGSISCEAISRGASYVVCVDNNKEAIEEALANVELEEAIRIINENNKIVDNKISIINADVVNFIKTTTSSFDYIFVDPPYDIDIDVVNNIIDLIMDNNILNNKGMLIIELGVESQIDNKYIYNVRKYGKTQFYFLRKE